MSLPFSAQWMPSARQRIYYHFTILSYSQNFWGGGGLNKKEIKTQSFLKLLSKIEIQTEIMRKAERVQREQIFKFKFIGVCFVCGRKENVRSDINHSSGLFVVLFFFPFFFPELNARFTDKKWRRRGREKAKCWSKRIENYESKSLTRQNVSKKTQEKTCFLTNWVEKKKRNIGGEKQVQESEEGREREREGLPWRQCYKLYSLSALLFLSFSYLLRPPLSFTIPEKQSYLWHSLGQAILNCLFNSPLSFYLC